MPRQCKCEEIKRTLQAKDAKVALPEVEGHNFFISRDYRGPNEAALKVSGNNVPLQTNWDLARAWKKVREQLPRDLQGEEKDWEQLLRKVVVTGEKKSFAFTTTRDVYTLRKNLDGLVCGQIDKNLHELCATFMPRFSAHYLKRHFQCLISISSTIRSRKSEHAIRSGMNRATTFILGGQTPTQRATVRCSLNHLPLAPPHRLYPV